MWTPEQAKVFPNPTCTVEMLTRVWRQEIVQIAKEVVPDIKTLNIPQGLRVDKVTTFLTLSKIRANRQLRIRDRMRSWTTSNSIYQTYSTLNASLVALGCSARDVWGLINGITIPFLYGVQSHITVFKGIHLDE